MNILITGGTGLIGSSFIKQFNQYSYTVLTRSPERAKSQLNGKINTLNTLTSLENLDDFDAVINLVGEPIIDKRWTDQQKTIITDSRLKITQQLTELFAHSARPPEVFISGSAIGIYGNRGNEILSEDAKTQQDDFPSKLCTEWEAQAMRAQPKTRVVLLRTGIVLTPDGGALAKMLTPFKLGLGGRIAQGTQYMSWIHFKDCINAIHHALITNTIAGPMNLVAPQPELNKVFAQTLAKTLHRFAIFPAPSFVLKTVLGESACLLLDSQRVVPSALLDSGFKFQWPDLASAMQDML
jgi:hypothetical protein